MESAAVADPTPESENDAGLEADRDSLSILPLAIVPLETAVLRDARLIKNVNLETVVEFFRDAQTGSGQLLPSELAGHCGWAGEKLHPDQATVQRLARLNSYDVYTLRIELRRIGVPVNDFSQLRLSDEKSRELAGYMQTFTRPLMQQVFGQSEAKVEDFNELLDMFKSPNKAEALKNLKLLAEKLQIELIEVPQFLEDYGDTFLSLAYFKECLDNIVPRVMDFLESVGELKGNYQLKNTPGFMSILEYLDTRLNAVITSITGRFESFDQHTKYLWENISAERFREVRGLITEHHATIGGVLCGLSVKMDAWDERFGHIDRSAAVMRRSEFCIGEMRQGLERIESIEASAPSIKDAH